MTNLTPEQMMADVKLLRAAFSAGCYCNEFDDEELGVCVCCIARQDALAATDRPEYREEG